MDKKLNQKRRTAALVIACVCLITVLLVIILMRYQKKDDSVSDDTPYLSEVEDFTQYSEEEMEKIIKKDTTSNLGCYYGNLSVSDREVFKERFPYLIRKDGVTTYTKSADGEVLSSTQSQLDYAIEVYQNDLASYDEEVIEKCKQIYAEEHPDDEIPMYFPVTQLYAAAGGGGPQLISTTCDFYVNFLIFGNDSKTKDSISLTEMQNSMVAPDGTKLNQSYFVPEYNYNEFIKWSDSQSKSNANTIAQIYNGHSDGAIKITAKVSNTTVVGEGESSLSGPNKVESVTVTNGKANDIKVVIDGWRDYLTVPGMSTTEKPALAYYKDEDIWHRSVLIFDMSYQVPTNAIPTVKQNVNKHMGGRLIAGTYMYPDGNRVDKDTVNKYSGTNRHIEYFKGQQMGTIGFFNKCQPEGMFDDNGKKLVIQDDTVKDDSSQIQSSHDGFQWNNVNKRYHKTEYPSKRVAAINSTGTTTSTWDNVNVQINLDYNTSGGGERKDHWENLYRHGASNSESERDIMDDYIWLAASGGKADAYKTGATLNILMVQNKETLTLEYETKKEQSSSLRNLNNFYVGGSKAKRPDKDKDTLDDFSITGGSGQSVSLNRLFQGKNVDLATGLRLDGHSLHNVHIYHLDYKERTSDNAEGFLGYDGSGEFSFAMGWLKNNNSPSWSKVNTYGKDPTRNNEPRSRRQNIYKKDGAGTYFANDANVTESKYYKYVFCNTKNSVDEGGVLSNVNSRFSTVYENEKPEIIVDDSKTKTLKQILNSTEDGEIFTYNGETCMKIGMSGTSVSLIKALNGCKSTLAQYLSVTDEEDTENAKNGVGAAVKSLEKYGIPFLYNSEGNENAKGSKKYETISYSDKIFLWENRSVKKAELTSKKDGVKYTTRKATFLTHDRAQYNPGSKMTEFTSHSRKTAFPFYTRTTITVYFVEEEDDGTKWRTSHYVTKNDLLNMIDDTTKPDWTYEEVTPHVLNTNLTLNNRNRVGSYTATEKITFTHAHTIDHGCYYCPGHYHSSIYGGYYTYCAGCVRSCNKETVVVKTNSIPIEIINDPPAIDIKDVDEKTESDIIKWSDIAKMFSVSDKEDNSYNTSGSNPTCSSCNTATYVDYPKEYATVQNPYQRTFVFKWPNSKYPHRENTHTPTLTVDIGNLKLEQTNPGGVYPIKITMMDGDGRVTRANTELVIDWVAPEFTLNESPESNGLIYHTDETIPQGDFFTNKVITKAADPMRQWAVEKPGAMQSVSEAETIDCYAAGHPIGVDLRNPLGYYNLPKYITIVDTKELYVQRRSAGAIRPNDARQQVTDICRIFYENEGDSATNWRAANSVTEEKIVEVTLRCYNPRNNNYYTDRTLKVKIINDAPVVSGGTHLLTLYEQYTEDQFLDWWSTQAWDFEDGTITGDDNAGTYYGTKPYNDSRDTVFNHKSEIHQRYGIEKTQYSAIQNHSLRYNGDTYYHRFKIVEWNGKDINARGTTYFDTTEEGTFTIIVGYWDEDMAYAEAPITVIVRKTEQQMKPYLRYIDKEFFSKPAYYGGLADDSIWKTNPEYNKQLEEDLNTDVTDASEENNWKGCEIVYVFEPDDIKEFKEYIKQKVYNPKPNG